MCEMPNHVSDVHAPAQSALPGRVLSMSSGGGAVSVHSGSQRAPTSVSVSYGVDLNLLSREQLLALLSSQQPVCPVVPSTHAHSTLPYAPVPDVSDACAAAPPAVWGAGTAPQAPLPAVNPSPACAAASPIVWGAGTAPQAWGSSGEAISNACAAVPPVLWGTGTAPRVTHGAEGVGAAAAQPGAAVVAHIPWSQGGQAAGAASQAVLPARPVTQGQGAEGVGMVSAVQREAAIPHTPWPHGGSVGGTQGVSNVPVRGWTTEVVPGGPQVESGVGGATYLSQGQGASAWEPSRGPQGGISGKAEGRYPGPEGGEFVVSAHRPVVSVSVGVPGAAQGEAPGVYRTVSALGGGGECTGPGD